MMFPKHHATSDQHAVIKLFWAIMLLIVGHWTWARSSKARIEVIAEGFVFVRRDQRQFTPFAEVTKVEVEGLRVLIWRRSGASGESVLRFLAASPRAANEIRARILEAKERPVPSGGAEMEPSLARGDRDTEAWMMAFLARGDRDTKAWIRAASELANDGGVPYRAATLPSETLWRVIEEGSTPAEIRVGAALALRPSLDPDGRERLRIASSATPDPEVKPALDSIVNNEDDAKLELTLSRMKFD